MENKPLKECVCKVCDKPFSSIYIKTICSKACRNVLAKIRNKVYQDSIHTDQINTCKECSEQFVVPYGDRRTIYCSKACSLKNNKRSSKAKHGSKHRERAKYFGVSYEAVNVLSVFDRDNWTCKICGIDTPKELKGTASANAPELDHIIPLSKGGSHSYDNVQCACKRCNGIKSDKVEGEALERYLYERCDEEPPVPRFIWSFYAQTRGEANHLFNTLP